MASLGILVVLSCVQFVHAANPGAMFHDHSVLVTALPVVVAPQRPIDAASLTLPPIAGKSRTPSTLVNVMELDPEGKSKRTGPLSAMTSPSLSALAVKVTTLGAELALSAFATAEADSFTLPGFADFADKSLDSLSASQNSQWLESDAQVHPH
jgi:hypothetical protein